jgi:hypothetical protein
MNYLKIIWASFRDWELAQAIIHNWKESSKWLLYTYIGGLFPVWGGFLLFSLYKKSPGLENFTDNGEFALYSAALLAPSLYYILKDYKESNFLYRHFFAAVAIVGLFISVLYYTAVVSVVVGQIPIPIDLVNLRNVTWVLFIVTTILSYLVNALDHERNYNDITKERQRDFEKLKKDFVEVREGQQ